MPMTLHPNSYAVLSRKVESVFNVVGKAEVAIAAVAMPLLVSRFTCGWSWALHAFEALAALAMLGMLVQGVLQAGITRANFAAGEWFLRQEAEKDAKAKKTQPKKGFRVAAGHDPCPCGSGERYRSCCRPRHLRVAGRTELRALHALVCAGLLVAGFCLAGGRDAGTAPKQATKARCGAVVLLPLPDGGFTKGMVVGQDGGLNCLPGMAPQRQRPSG